ncbi:hypothetical protein SAMN02982989_0941 [Xaviernesmea oryzae]|uniref:Uncharacterized protein n=1 Tax=Xaviernesmea oryzae TaxID=464029 RepID=A0A1X7FVG3_9HYPH|nr:hypothetical protein SAMN02982989_0941 [Xaviernesmea oryzae]
MSPRSSHANFLLYFQKMLLNAEYKSERNPGNRKVGIAFPAVCKRRLLKGPPLVGPEIPALIVRGTTERKSKPR